MHAANTINPLKYAFNLFNPTVQQLTVIVLRERDNLFTTLKYIEIDRGSRESTRAIQLVSLLQTHRDNETRDRYRVQLWTRYVAVSMFIAWEITSRIWTRADFRVSKRHMVRFSKTECECEKDDLDRIDIIQFCSLTKLQLLFYTYNVM